jgi:CRP/FNR family transcriptional regulator
MNLPDIIRTFSSIQLPAGQQVFTQGQACENYIVLAEGQIKVFSRSEDGRELVLYRIGAGEMCVLTTSCLLGNSRYPAEAVTEADITAYVLPVKDFDALLDENREFRRFVFGSMSQRLGALMAQLEQVTMESVERRLARFLLNRSQSGRVPATHQDIATDIGSAREVVSRHLKVLEKQGLIRLLRGVVEILNEEALLGLV